MNVHTPERQSNESQAQYRERRAVSHALVKAMLRGPTQEPAHLETNADGTPKPAGELSKAAFWLGQHNNKRRNAQRKLKKIFGFRQFRIQVKKSRAEKKAAAS